MSCDANSDEGFFDSSSKEEKLELQFGYELFDRWQFFNVIFVELLSNDSTILFFLANFVVYDLRGGFIE